MPRKTQNICVKFSLEELNAVRELAQKDNRPVSNLVYHTTMLYIKAQKENQGREILS